MMNDSNALATVTRLLDATNDHDLDGIVRCFDPGYRNGTPAHPQRNFTGREQVRRNWSTILGGVPDLRVTIPALAVDGDEVWTEWRMSGTRRDGTTHEMAGVVVFTIPTDLITAARFYLEPVGRETGTADDAVARLIVREAQP
jgi:ketosteroid isomerase-like protein